jgi:hypothetical protein
MPSGGGGTTVEAPKPSPQEIALQEKQLEILNQQTADYAQMKPILYQMMGYKEDVTDTTAQTANPEYAAWKTKYDALMGQGEGPKTWIPPANDAETGHWSTDAREAGLAQIGAAPAQFTTTGGKTSKIVPMTQEEKLAQMNPLQRAQYEINMSLAEREKQALEGKLPISPALEEAMTKQMTNLESYMSTRLGPRWRESTPGIQAVTQMSAKHDMIREEARRGAISDTMGLMTGGTNAALNQTMTTAGGLSSTLQGGNQLFQMAGQAQEPYRYYNNLSYQANVENARSKNAASAGLLGGIGQLAGTALSSYALYAGLAA